MAADYGSIVRRIEEELRLRFRDPNDPGLFERRKRLRALFRSVPDSRRAELRAQLGEQPTGDALSALFHGRISGPTRRELLRILGSPSPSAEGPLVKGPDGPAPETRSSEVGNDAADGVLLAFVVPRDAFGRAAELFLQEWYPSHQLHRVTSLAELMEIAAAAVQPSSGAGAPARLAELVIVAHANEHGGLKLRLPTTSGATDTGDANVTPWAVAALGTQIRDGANTEFAKHRSVIRQALDPSSLIIVRGCFFGLSDEGLQAVAMLFGGTAAVYAPTAAQGFEAAPVTRGQEAAAYDSLARAGLLSRDTLHDGQSEKKEKVLAIAARRGGLVPTQFFITSHSEYTMLKDLSDRDQMSAEAKWLKTRPAFPDPSGWHARSRLSRDELLEHARDLRATYLPEVAPELLMMQDVWLSRLPGEPAAGPSFDTDDPLGGLPPSDMGDGNLLAADAAQVADSTVNVWRSSEMTGTILSVDDHDPLLAGDLRIDPPSSDQRKQANVFDEETLNRLATPPTGEQPFSGRGYVEPLRDGGLRLWNFRIGSGSLRDEFHPALSTLAGTLKDRGTTVTVTGHTSTPGGESANERVALSRARHVASDLIKQGVRPDRVIVMERGEGDPLAPDVISGRADPELAARNRRVEIRPFFIPPPFRESDRGASATADGGRQIAEEVDRLTATSTDPLGHAVDVTTLALDIVGHLGEFAEHAGKFATVAGPVSLLGPVIDWIKFTRDVRRMKEAWLREARVIGLGLGLAATRILAADDRLGVDISAADLERVLRDPETWKQAVLDKKQEDEFREYARTAAAVTLPPARWMDAIRQSLTMTAELVNAVLRQAEAELRRRLMQQGLTADTLESEYKSRLRRLRIECVGQLEHYLKAELAGAGR